MNVDYHKKPLSVNGKKSKWMQQQSGVCFYNMGEMDGVGRFLYKCRTSMANRDAEAYYIKLMLALVEPGRVKVKHIATPKGTTHPDRHIYFLIDVQPFNRMGMLSYLTAIRYMDEAASSVEHLYSLKVEGEPWDDVFKRLQSLHYSDKWKGKGHCANGGCHCMISHPAYVPDDAPISIAQYQDRLLGKKCTEVFMYFASDKMVNPPKALW